MEHQLVDNTLQIRLPQRLDTATSSAVEVEIKDLCQSLQHSQVVLDAEDTTYLSSSGLRVILAVVRRGVPCRMIQVQREVYTVLEMTGFLRLLSVERAPRQVSIEGCSVIGRGSVGTVYRLTEETILKVFRPGTPLAEVQREIQVARDSFVLGMPTAISFETVRVGEQYGLVHELLDAHTLATQINNDREHAERYGQQLGRLMRQNHDIVVPAGMLPDAIEQTERRLDTLHRYLADDEVDALREIYRAIPVSNRLLHCDLHPKNVMVSRGELMLIDMGEVCSGNPLQDLSHTYSSLVSLVGDYEGIIGMPREVGTRVFASALKTYLGTDDESLVARRTEQIRVASLLRNFTWLSLSDSFPQAAIDECRQAMHDRVITQMDHIREVLPTLCEWT